MHNNIWYFEAPSICIKNYLFEDARFIRKYLYTQLQKKYKKQMGADVLEQQEGDSSTSRVPFVAPGHPQLS